MGHNPMDAEYLKNKAAQKRLEDRLEEMRRESQERTQKSIAYHTANVKEYSDKFEQDYAGFLEHVQKRSQHLGMESIPTLILQFGPGLKAFARMSEDFKMHVLSRICLSLAENFNYQNSTPLMLTAEAARQARVFLDSNFNTEGHFQDALPPVFVPYLADVNDQGVLSVSLDVPNTQLSSTPREVDDGRGGRKRTSDRQEFIEKYSTDFETSIANWINALSDADGNTLTVVDVPNEGRKIRVGPDNPGQQVYLSKDEFRDLRTRVLTPQLEHYFGVEFKPEAESNTPRPGR